VRAPLLATVVVLVASTASAVAETGAVLTLKGPVATTYGHTVDFAGRLDPAVAGTRIRLLRGSKLISSTRLRRDGTYRFKVELGRPGPFRTVWRGIASKLILVRIQPKLDTALTGTRLAGRPLAFTARLRPADAGRLRVRVIRSGRETYRGAFSGLARVHLGTSDVGSFEVRAETLPAKGYARVSRDIHIALRAPALRLGDQGPLVGTLVRRLASLGYAAPSGRSVFDDDVLESVYAFEKAQSLSRTGVADSTFWQRLDRPRPLVARYQSPADHIEVDKARQILLVVRGGQVTLAAPVSTAGIAGYYTPVGRFAIYRKVPGYDPSPLGVLYKPMYFYGGYAIHGNPSVPPYPASHGCIRVPNFVIERLYASEPYGETVIVYE
jgi:lipoprotein-anchoring transpeptidase ErfK/SrfK